MFPVIGFNWLWSDELLSDFKSLLTSARLRHLVSKLWNILPSWNRFEIPKRSRLKENLPWAMLWRTLWHIFLDQVLIKIQGIHPFQLTIELLVTKQTWNHKIRSPTYSLQQTRLYLSAWALKKDFEPKTLTTTIGGRRFASVSSVFITSNIETYFLDNIYSLYQN